LYLIEVDLVHFYELVSIILQSEKDTPPIFLVDWRDFGNTKEFADSMIDKIITRPAHHRARIQWADATTAKLFLRNKARAKEAENKSGGFWWRDNDLVANASVFSYDDPDILDVKSVQDPKFLPCLRRQFRTIHKQVWRDQLVQMSFSGKTILLVTEKGESPKPTMLDFFLQFPKSLLDCVAVETNLSQAPQKSRSYLVLIFVWAIILALVIIGVMGRFRVIK
jgi:hypothetical protein